MKSASSLSTFVVSTVAVLGLIGVPTAYCKPFEKARLRIFHDWIVVCDTDGTCRVAGLRPDITRSESSPFVVIEKRLEATTSEVTFGLSNPSDPSGQTLKLVTDEDRAVIPLRNLTFKKPQESSKHLTAALPTDRVSGFLTMLRKNIQIEFQDVDGITVGELSLEGSRTALKFSDEVQAKFNQGDAQDATSPPADVPDKPISFGESNKRALRVADDIVRYNSLFRIGGVCSDLPAGTTRSTRTWTIDDSRSLISIDCIWRNRQVGTVFFIVTKEDSKELAPLSFPWPESVRRDEGDFDFVVTSAEVSPADGTISFLKKTDTVGDCGALGSFAFNGTNFELTKLHVMPLCRGVPAEAWLPMVVVKKASFSVPQKS